MKKLIVLLIAAGFSLGIAAWAQTTNPLPGYVWTFFGPTLGGGWAPSVANQQISIVVAPGSAPPLVQGAANFVGDGVNDQGAILAAINSATLSNKCEDAGVTPITHCYNARSNFKLICIAGTYNFGGTLVIPPVAEATIACTDGVMVNGPSGALDAIQITGALRAVVNLPTAIYANSTGCAVSTIPPAGIDVRDSIITGGSLMRVGQTLTGKGLCLNPGTATNRQISFQGIWGFDYGVSAVAPGTLGTDPTIDTNIFDLGFVRGNNHNLSINSAGRLVNANTWKINIDQTTTGAVGIETNSGFDTFEAIIGNFIGPTGTVIQLDSGALSNQINTYPSVNNIVGENGTTLANVIVDNGIVGSNHIGGLTRPAANQQFPTDKAGTTSSIGVMLGLAGAITPVSTGQVQVTISGAFTNSIANDGVNAQLFFGTGTAPVNGAAITGTGACRSMAYTVSSATFQTPFTITCQVAPLKLGTTYWLDLVYAAVGGGTATIRNVTVNPVEFQ